MINIKWGPNQCQYVSDDGIRGKKAQKTDKEKLNLDELQLRQVGMSDVVS